MSGAVCLLYHTPLWCVQVQLHLLYTQRSQLRTEIQSLQSATYFSSNALQLKVASSGSFKFTNVLETGCLHYKGSDDLIDSVFATPDAAVSLADILMKSVAVEASRHTVYSILVSYIVNITTHTHQQMHNLYKIKHQSYT